LSGAVAKLASITFLSLAFSYWIDNLGFITEGKLAAILIKPSLGVSNWPVIYIINTAPSVNQIITVLQSILMGSFANMNCSYFLDGSLCCALFWKFVVSALHYILIALVLINASNILLDTYI
jgi:hypothetical protein